MPAANFLKTDHAYALADKDNRLLRPIDQSLGDLPAFIAFPTFEAAEAGRELLRIRSDVYGYEVVYVGDEEPEELAEAREHAAKEFARQIEDDQRMEQARDWTAV